MNDYDESRFLPTLEKMSSQGRTALLPALHAAQNLFGYIPDKVAIQIGRALKVPLSEVFGVIDFYSMFYSHPVDKTIVHVCHDPACSMAGTNAINKILYRRQQPDESLNDSDSEFLVESAPCLGLCENAPAIMINRKSYTLPVTSTKKRLLTEELPRPRAKIYGTKRLLTKSCGLEHVVTLKEYQSSGGYTPLKKALGMQPEEIIEQVISSGLVGRGGAAFPTGIKWQSAFRTVDPCKYLICNADEAEPGTFKDRVLIEDNPHQLIEGIVLAAYAIGAHKAYIYIRGEYDNAYQILNHALDEAAQEHIVGTNILNSGFDLDVEIRQGAGAYVCGEETALFESIEGKRGLPRVKPPFPTTQGLFNKPTVINNVETLCNIPLILNNGPQEFRKIGTVKSSGTKLFCLSGDIVRPGLYEIPFGTTIRELLFDLGGGISGSSAFQTALIGGASGGFLTADQLDLPLSFEDLRASGVPLGSGAIIVCNQTRDLKEIFLRLAHFFVEESCGKCYPCQLGTQRQLEIVNRIAAGNPQAKDISRLQDIGATMTDTSLCGLGQTAASAILSAIKHWPHLFSGTG